MTTKTQDPKAPGGGQNPNDMGGPQFHPDVTPVKKPARDGKDSQKIEDTAILREDQVPPL